MREGLRSGVARARPVTEQVAIGSVEVGEKVSVNHDLEQKGIDVEEDKNLNSELIGPEEVVGSVLSLPEGGDGSEEKQCREGEDLGGFKSTGFSRDSGKRSRTNEVRGDCGVKKLRKRGGDRIVPISSRVLRSRSLVKNEDDKEADKEVTEGDLEQSLSGKIDECEKERVELDADEIDVSAEKLKHNPDMPPQIQGDDEVPCEKAPEEQVVKRKRGRPFKIQGNNKVTRVKPRKEGELKRKHGRPFKVQGNNKGTNVKPPKEGELKRKLGRPFKVQGNNKVAKVKSPKEGELKPKRGRPSKLQGNNKVTKVKSPKEGELKRKRGRPCKVRENDEVPIVEPPKEDVVKHKRGRPFKVRVNNEVSTVEPLKEQVLPLESVLEGSHMVESLCLMEVGAPEVECRREVMTPKVKEGKVRGILKRKRGRPPKLKVDTDMDEVPKGSGKCRKVKFDDGERKGLPVKSKRRGRPPKVQTSNVPLKADLSSKGTQEGLTKIRRDAKFVRVMRKLPIKNSYLSRKRNGKKLYSRRFLPAKKASPGTRQKVVHAIISMKRKGDKGVKTKQQEGNSGQSRSGAKQLVRDRIVEILLSAGWKVEYRQRMSKDYQDAVYVNPEGKTHWSATLAYRRFLEQYEADRDNSSSSKSDFTFTPIPQEDLAMLKRVAIKGRRSKNGQSGDTSDGEVAEVRKRKEKVSSGKSHKEMPVRNRKRQGTQSKRRCALLARNSKEGVESDIDSYTPYDGKRTVLAWMIDLGTVPLNGKVQYMNQRRTHIKLHGRITMDGIHCECCSEIFTISKFESHAGSKLCQPSENIYLENGSSLLQCQLDSWNKQEESERKGFHLVDVGGDDPNDDTCGICGDGGDLICCDGCPSTFHQSCLDIQKFPSGDWHCVYCSCKFCGIVGGKTSQGDDNEVTISTLLACRMCEEKYHHPCVQPRDATPDNASSTLFCGKNCQELFERLKMLLGVKHELEEGFSWTLVRRYDIISDISESGMYKMIECNSKLAVALSVMNECFLPIVDHRSGVNLIRNILYNSGSNFNRLNYSGFVTAILERDDEIISAASIRIHGNHLAEMPFIGTRHLFRRQGMCRRLLTAIESALCSLHVEKLVIPAISELTQTWTSVFGFSPLESSSRKKMRNMNLLVFPGVAMLQKPILDRPKEVISSSGLEVLNLGKENEITNCSENDSDVRCSAEPDSNIFSGGASPCGHKINGELDTNESVSQLPVGSLNDASSITCETVNIIECPLEIKCAIPDASRNNIEGANEPSEGAGEEHNCIAGSHVHVPGMGTVELDSQLNNQSICEQKSRTGSEATTHASGEGAESVSCEVTKCNTENNPNPRPVHVSEGISLDTATEDKPTVDSCCDLTEAVTDSCHDQKAPVDDGCEDPKEARGDCDDLNVAATQLQTDSNSIQQRANTNSSEQSESESQPEQKSSALGNTETLCSSSSGSGVALLCASGGSSAHGTPEVIILSNPAS